MTRLTESEFWDNEWNKINLKKGILKESHFYFGRGGIFTKMTNGYIAKNDVKKILEIGGGGENYRLLALAKWRGMEPTVL